jgi:hypothetical protein
VLVTSVRVVRTYDKGSGSRARRQEGSSVATTKQQLPPFVVDGEYEDHEWREIAADPEKQTKRNQPRYVAGPLQHPYGKSAYLDEKPVGDEVIRRWRGLRSRSQPRRPGSRGTPPMTGERTIQSS